MKEDKISFSMLLASSGHDMKNVLGTVLESVDWLETKLHNKLDEEQQVEFKKVRELVTLVNNELMQLLSLYKFEEGQYAIMGDDYEVSDFLQFQAAFLHPFIEGTDLEVEYTVDDDLLWYFDETLMSSAVRNAAMNALKFAKHKISLSAQADDKMLTIQVEDDGDGYPESMVGRVSDTVSGVDFSSGSTGLGLHFADQVAALHENNQVKGYVELANDSRLGGANFKIHIPR